MQVRRVLPQDHEPCDRILRAAFAPSEAEVRLVVALRQRCLDLLEFVLLDGNEVLACACYSPAYRGVDGVGYHLAPVAVRPDVQRRRCGTRLITETLAMEPVVSQAVFVLGDPAYYGRFGFRIEPSVRCRYDPEGRHFQSLRWDRGAITVGYHAAFDELG